MSKICLYIGQSVTPFIFKLIFNSIMAIHVNVHVRDQMFPVFCGQGTQRVKWLSDVALHRYESFNSTSDPGLAKGMRFENGELLDLESMINDKIKGE